MKFFWTQRLFFFLRFKFYDYKNIGKIIQRKTYFANFVRISRHFIAYSLFVRYGLAKVSTIGAKDLKGLSDTETEKLPKRLKRYFKYFNFILLLGLGILLQSNMMEKLL